MVYIRHLKFVNGLNLNAMQFML